MRLFKGVMLGLIILTPFWFGVYESSSATYYMRVDGSAANKTAATGPCGTVANTMSVSTHNSQSFVAGDVINLCDDGGIYRSELIPPSSGSNGSPITYQAASGDNPIVSGANVISEWAQDNNAMSTDANAVAIYDFNEDLTDSSTNGRNLTAVGTPAYAADAFDYSLSSAATGGYGKYPDAASGDTGAFDFGMGNFRLDAWIKFTSHSSGNLYPIVSKDSATNTVGYSMRLWDHGNGNAYAWCHANDGSHNVVAQDFTISYGDGKWHHMACVADRAGTLSIWVDGVSRASASMSALTATTDNTLDFTVGAEADGGIPFPGQIGQVTVSNGALSSFPTSAGSSSNIWNSPLTTQPNIVIFNGTKGTKTGTLEAVDSANEWFWGSNVLTVYSASDPGSTIQAGQRSHAIYAVAKDYITLDGIEFQGGNHASNATVHFENGGGTTRHGLIVKNCTVKYSAGDGIMFSHWDAVGTTTESSIIGNTIVGGRNGISLYKVNATAGNENIISGNDVSGFQIEGINIRGNYWIIERNYVHDGGSLDQIGGGIHLYSGGIGEGTGDYDIIRYNRIKNMTGHSHDGYGISVDQWCDNSEIYGNLIDTTDGPGIYLFDAANGSIYNNTVFNPSVNTAGDGLERGGIRLTGSLTENASIKNNICYSLATNSYPVYVDSSVIGNSLDITNNIWYHTTGDFYYWSGNHGNVLATWNAFTGVGTDLNTDPLLTSTSGHNFHLQSSSPSIDAGANLGASYNIDLDGMDQNDFGIAWDIGAFLYNNSGFGAEDPFVGIMPVQNFRIISL